MSLEDYALNQLENEQLARRVEDETKSLSVPPSWEDGETVPIYPHVKELVDLFVKYEVPALVLYEIVAEWGNGTSFGRKYRPVEKGWTVTPRGQLVEGEFPFAITVTGLCVANFQEQYERLLFKSGLPGADRYRGISRSDFIQGPIGIGQYLTTKRVMYINREDIVAGPTTALTNLFRRTAVEIVAGRAKEHTNLFSV